MKPLAYLLAILCSSLSAAQPAPSPSSMLVYFGTYTGEKSQGIYVSTLDLQTGALSPPQLAAETPNPSFLAVHPARDYLYAINEISEFEGKPGGSVTAFSIDRGSGMLKAINRQSTVGPGPAHLIVDAAGRNVLVANYGGGSVAVLPIAPDGSLQPASSFVQHRGSGGNPDRQKAPHAHAVQLDAANRYAYVPDLGIDKVLIYRFDSAKGSLVPNDPGEAPLPPGSGPRHLAFGPQGRFAFVINELSLTITSFQVDPERGGLTAAHTVSTLPAEETIQKGYSTAEVQVHPSGRFLYGSNRGHDTIAVYTLDQETGRLTPVQHEPTQGSTPRNFGIDPTGKYLLAANQRSDSVVVFRIDPGTGRLTPTGHTVKVGSPVAVKFIGR